MIRAGLVLSLGALLSACVTGDRVTLLPHAGGGPVGEVAVLSAEEGGADIAVLNQENQQARLRATGARVRQLSSVDPEYAQLMESLPVASDAVALPGFRTGVGGLTPQQQNSIRSHMCKVQFLDGCEEFYPAECRNQDTRPIQGCPRPVPGYQILVRGFTDSEGDEDLNLQLSQERAEAVASYMRTQGYEVSAEDVLGMGEFSAKRANGDEVSDADFRRVDVVIR